MNRLIGLTACVLLSVIGAMAQCSDPKLDAAKIWEKVIEAKGGHERLQSVKTLVVSQKTSYYHGFHKYSIRGEHLYVFPNKYWMWDESSVFGLSVSMTNHENGTTYTTNYNGIEPFRLNQLSDERQKGFNNLAGTTPHLLIESKWNKPAPERASCAKIDGKESLVVQTRLLRWRIDFVIDQKSYLPTQVITYRDDNGEPSVTRLSGYMPVDGIMMPTRVSYDGDSPYKCSYQINIDYDESIFRRAPPEGSGPGAWRKR
jgi:hypothetical protein